MMASMLLSDFLTFVQTHQVPSVVYHVARHHDSVPFSSFHFFPSLSPVVIAIHIMTCFCLTLIKLLDFGTSHICVLPLIVCTLNVRLNFTPSSHCALLHQHHPHPLWKSSKVSVNFPILYIHLMPTVSLLL